MNFKEVFEVAKELKIRVSALADFSWLVVKVRLSPRKFASGTSVS